MNAATVVDTTVRRRGAVARSLWSMRNRLFVRVVVGIVVLFVLLALIGAALGK